MTAAPAILLTGTLFRQPLQKTSTSSGRRFTTATVRAGADNSTSDFWTVLAFGDTAQAELARLGEGEKLSVQGSLRLELYEGKDGKTKISRTVFADHILALRAPPKERKTKAPPAGSKAGDAMAKRSIMPDPDLNGDIPF